MVIAALDPGTVLILVVVVAIPIGAIAFATGAGKALGEIGKGGFAMDHDLPQRSGSSSQGLAPVRAAVREQEIRQMVEARSYRREQRGEEPLDVEREMERLLADDGGGGGELAVDSGLREEVRQLVVARNERRMRRGEDPVDVDEEVNRQLRELENLGQ
ncbi:MAG: hypothetical protein EXQ70_05290 [Solirubrobacterales bacterium]|nr:hypothetical protein [Solirubrobacterales bacterium]